MMYLFFIFIKLIKVKQLEYRTRLQTRITMYGNVNIVDKRWSKYDCLENKLYKNNKFYKTEELH